MSAVIEHDDKPVAEAGVTTHPLMRMMERIIGSDQPDAMVKVRELWVLYQDVQAKESEAVFNRDFAAMQGDIPVIAKNGKIVVNGEIRSHYALYEDIDRATKPVLQRYGFALSFRIDPPPEKGVLSVTGILMHKQGHREQTTFVLAADTSGSKNAVQAQGSALSYAKRYICSMLLNIAQGDEHDDDGASTEKSGKYISEDQQNELDALIRDNNLNRESIMKWLATGDVHTLAEIKSVDFQKVRATIAKKIR